ncbi:hypothetical protein FB451DRAFT_1559205 [Mycena latifolia]|nr:hypothetical protein FB451DRAFT_1559205 [Mycena latifolia]
MAPKSGEKTPTMDSALTLRPAHQRRRLTNLLIGAGAAFLMVMAGYTRHSLPCTSERKIGSVEWLPASQCSPDTECGSVIVPKDYFDPRAGTASIAIARFKATKFPKKIS